MDIEFIAQYLFPFTNIYLGFTFYLLHFCMHYFYLTLLINQL